VIFIFGDSYIAWVVVSPDKLAARDKFILSLIRFPALQTSPQTKTKQFLYLWHFGNNILKN